MTIINDIIAVLKGLSLIDYILYFSVLVLIILTTCLIYVIKSEENNDDIKIDKEEQLGSEKMNSTNELDLQSIVNEIEEAPKPQIDMTNYEKEQEQKAIISYDELVKEANQKKLNYKEEELVDNCIPTKKIDLNNLIYEPTVKNTYIDNPKPSPLFNYEKEEAFLNALKELNEMLN